MDFKTKKKEEHSPWVSSEEEDREGGKAFKRHACQAKCQKERQLHANLILSGVAHLPSFIFWADQSLKKIIAIVKFYLFSTMDPSLKSRYQCLSQHLIAQSTYQNPNQSIKNWHNRYSSKGCKGSSWISLAPKPCSQKNTFMGKRFYSAPGLEPKFKEDPDGFNYDLSFTISNFANLPHKDDNTSPFTFFMWILVKQTTGKLVEKSFEVKGGFNGIVECAWKSTAYSHLTLPSNNTSNSLHNCMGLSFQLQAALEKIRQVFYKKDHTKSS
ncbi:hypothetical protein VP01_1645g5 [Puccinia sorghi]|uniref:Tet-like 2OG-Fe(II) oxygenase domain-containing protein n=1 Tax=Puccinia sorghi TaxID=27349 RepID=A0A0L6VH81_9BASI|nr:hypothetical protein VP01_1645g5 [Puccinia sorghi]